MSIRITGLLDFVNCILNRTKRFGNWTCLHSQLEEQVTPTQLSPLGRANLNPVIEVNSNSF
jgi:hypothetical protein